MLILLIYFCSRNLSPPKKLIIAALFFSWLGDILLLANQFNDGLFTLGLISFLIAHIFYTLHFRKIAALNRALQQLKTLPVVCVTILIILTYGIAQLSITEGALRNLEELK